MSCTSGTPCGDTVKKERSLKVKVFHFLTAALQNDNVIEWKIDFVTVLKPNLVVMY